MILCMMMTMMNMIICMMMTMIKMMTMMMDDGIMDG
jgi:hypothetical protein